MASPVSRRPDGRAPQSARSVGMFPSPLGESQWDKIGNGHFRAFTPLIVEHGWMVQPLEVHHLLDDDCDHVDAVHINWTERLAITTAHRRPIRLWARLRAFRDTVKADRILRGIARNALRPIAKKRPLIYQIHDLESNWLQPRATWLIDQAFKAACLDLASAWVVHERSCLSAISDRHRPPPCTCICPLGDYAPFHGPAISRAEARRRLGLPAHGMVFLFSGYSSPRRNPAAAAAVIARLDPGTATLLVASTNGHEYLPAPISANLHLHSGLLKPETVRDVCCAADWVLMPGRRYLTSAVIRTALSYGRPVICPDFGCQTDMAREAAIWLADDSEPALQAALQAALRMTTPEYQVFCAAAERRNTERTWSASAATYIQMLDTVSGAGVARPNRRGVSS